MDIAIEIASEITGGEAEVGVKDGDCESPFKTHTLGNIAGDGLSSIVSSSPQRYSLSLE